MKKKIEIKYYPPLEEKINIYSHALGMFLSTIAFLVLLNKGLLANNYLTLISVLIYPISMLTLYTASTLYHSSKDGEKRYKLKIFDHCSIYLLIAGTYSPLTLITLKSNIGWWVFGITWFMGITGIVLKLFFTGRYKFFSTSMYVLMGWNVVFFINPLIESLAPKGLYWLFLGGIIYTIGAAIYSIKKIKLNHAIFHIFVLLGSFCHFMTIYYYVL